MKAVWNGQVIAESNDTVYIEGNQYFPPDSVNQDFLTDSDLTTECHWKGTANYYHLVDGDKKGENLAWTYLNPLPSAEQKVKRDITGFVAFYPEVQVTN